MKLLLSRHKLAFVTTRCKRCDVSGADYNVDRAPKNPQVNADRVISWTNHLY